MREAQSAGRQPCCRWKSPTCTNVPQHMMEVHREEVAKPDYKFKVVKTFKYARGRQVAEVVREGRHP